MHANLIIAGDDLVRIPKRAFAFQGFRRWLHSENFPKDWHISFIGDHIEVDPCMEEFFEHGQVKAEIGAVLHLLLKEMKFGRFAPDGTRFTSPKARLSTEPDGMVVSHDAMKTGRVRFASGRSGRNTELIGIPDIVIEIVSTSSEEKDKERLMDSYFKAQIPEYWLIDVRDGAARFDIHVRKPSGYAPGRKLNGWVKSQVLGKSFCLTTGEDELGAPEYRLAYR